MVPEVRRIGIYAGRRASEESRRVGARRRRVLDLVAGQGNHNRMPYQRGMLAIALATLLVGLTAIAYADPPDPTWIGGYWDNDDFDTAVDFITSASAIPAPPHVDAGPLWVPVAWVEPAEPDARSAPPKTLACPRAPPTSLSSS